MDLSNNIGNIFFFSKEDNFSGVKKFENFNNDKFIVLSNCIKYFSFFCLKIFKLLEILLKSEDKFILLKQENISFTISKTLII